MRGSNQPDRGNMASSYHVVGFNRATNLDEREGLSETRNRRKLHKSVFLRAIALLLPFLNETILK
jgi:hypothetical protein